MAKSLKKIIKNNPSVDYLKNKGEKDFAGKHKVEVVDDANDNDDVIFKGKIIQPHDARHGFPSNSAPKDSYGATGPMKAGIITTKEETELDENFKEGTRVKKTMGVRQSGVITKPFHWKQSTDGTYSEPKKGYHPVKWDDGTKGYVHKHHIQKEETELDERDQRFHVVRQHYSLEAGQVGKDVKEKIVSKHHSIKQAGNKIGSMISGKMSKGPEGHNERGRGVRMVVRDTHTGKEYSRNDAKKFQEEIELDEISKELTGNYIKKATQDIHDKARTGGGPGFWDRLRKINKRKKNVGKAVDRLTKEETEQLDESMTRKHFREVANTVRSIEDPKKRQEFADHHANIFAKANPRFDHDRFHAACGTQTKKDSWGRTDTDLKKDYGGPVRHHKEETVQEGAGIISAKNSAGSLLKKGGKTGRGIGKPVTGKSGGGSKPGQQKSMVENLKTMAESRKLDKALKTGFLSPELHASISKFSKTYGKDYEAKKKKAMAEINRLKKAGK